MFEDIRRDLGMDENASMADVWKELPSCRTFAVKGVCPKLGRWFAWNDACAENLQDFHVLKCVLAYSYKDQPKLDPDAAAERARLASATRVAAQGDGSKADMRKEFSALKAALGGGTKLAYYVMTEQLWALCHILQVCTRPCWFWYSSEVKNTQNHLDSLDRTIKLQTTWAREIHLQELAGIPLSREPNLVRLIDEKRMWDTGEKCSVLVFHLLMRRCWSFVRHSSPPDCYAAILGHDVGARQAWIQ